MVIALLLLLAGAGVYVYPHLTEQMYRTNVENQYQAFLEETREDNVKYERLYRRLQKENEILFDNRQERLTNASAYENNRIDLRSYG